MFLILKHFLLTNGGMYVTAMNKKVHLSILCDQKVVLFCYNICGILQF